MPTILNQDDLYVIDHLRGPFEGRVSRKVMDDLIYTAITLWVRLEAYEQEVEHDADDYYELEDDGDD